MMKSEVAGMAVAVAAVVALAFAPGAVGAPWVKAQIASER